MANNKNNYITNMINKYGENWIVATNPEDIQKAGKRIVKEMAKGQFNYEEVGKYFLDGKFLDNIIIFTKNELDSNTLYLNGLEGTVNLEHHELLHLFAKELINLTKNSNF